MGDRFLRVLVCVFGLMTIGLGCTSWRVHSALRDLPCHDGWTTTAEGKSQAWTPSVEVSQELARTLSVGRTVGCFHRFPTGTILVLSVDDSGGRFVDTYKKVKGIWTKIHEEFIVFNSRQ